LPIDIKKIMGK